MTNIRPHLLAVDDEEINLRILEHYLSESDYQVTFAQSSNQAWDYLTNDDYQFDVLLLDWVMPDGDGLELLKKAKELDKYKHVPAIMISGLSAPSAISKGLNAGAFYYLTKPLGQDVLFSVLKAALNELNSIRSLVENQDKFADAFSLISQGQFNFKSLHDVNCLVESLSSMFPQNINTPIGLRELMINAIEHGNLGISYKDKTHLMEIDQWEEEVERRLLLADNQDKSATLEIDKNDNRVEITITDQGEGFNWEEFLEIDNERITDPHGRGIAIAKLFSFDELNYIAPGNIVKVRIDLRPQ